MRAEIERERTELLAKKGLAEGELNRTQQELQRREEELTRAQEQHQELERKLQDLQSKVIVGGVNLLEQAEHQERLLEASAQELAARKKKEAKLRRQLREKEVEHQDMEEKYASLQEEAVGKTKRLKEVWKQFQQAKEEVSTDSNIVNCVSRDYISRSPFPPSPLTFSTSFLSPTSVLPLLPPLSSLSLDCRPSCRVPKRERGDVGDDS